MLALRQGVHVTPVAVFQLELEDCPLLNTFMRWHWTKRRACSRRIATHVLRQAGRRKGSPLPGRPRILMTRFSTTKPDQDSAGTKLWLDVLVKLGWLADDSPDHVEVVSAWEKAPRGEGRVVVHVFESEAANEEHERKMGWL